MSAFGDQIKVFAVKVDAKTSEAFANIVSATQDSIVNGSPLTGSPGQPVGQYGPGYHPGEVGGALKTSYQVEFESPTSALISTNSPYAQQNEDGVARPGGGAYTQRSTVGGRHSVALTVAGFDRIVASEADRVAT